MRTGPPSVFAAPVFAGLDCALSTGAPENPRERLLARGAGALTEVELVALCLRTGAAGQSVLRLSRNLLDGFGGIGPLLSAPAERLLALPGLGPAKVATLLAAAALGERVAAASLSRQRPLQSSKAALAFLRQVIGRAEREVFGCLFLDARHRPLGFEALFYGSIDRAHVHPREVLKRALRYNAAAVILAHNHPSGVADPSASDLRLTEQLQQLLEQIDVRLLDHLVVTADGGISMAERGLLGTLSAAG